MQILCTVHEACKVGGWNSPLKMSFEQLQRERLNALQWEAQLDPRKWLITTDWSSSSEGEGGAELRAQKKKEVESRTKEGWHPCWGSSFTGMLNDPPGADTGEERLFVLCPVRPTVVLTVCSLFLNVVWMQYIKKWFNSYHSTVSGWNNYFIVF